MMHGRLVVPLCVLCGAALRCAVLLLSPRSLPTYLGTHCGPSFCSPGMDADRSLPQHGRLTG